MKKITCILLIALLLAALSPAVYADAWIPQEEDYNQALLDSPLKDGDCYALNVFLSNYAEMGNDAWAGKSPDNVCMEGLLKHFELNPTVYPEDVSSFVAPDGVRYMVISAQKFEKRMEDLFRRSVSAEEHPGYYDGNICVSAENYGAPLTVYASATQCYLLSPGYYGVDFEIYSCTDPSFTNRYGTANCNLPENRGEKIAEGFAHFYYNGDEDATSFYAYEFSLDYYHLMEITGTFPYTNQNLPYDPSLYQTEEPHTEATPSQSTVQTTAPSEETAAVTEASTMPTEEKGYQEMVDAILDKAGSSEKSPETMEQPTGGGSSEQMKIIVIVLLILVLCLGALVVILLVFRKKR